MKKQKKELVSPPFTGRESPPVQISRLLHAHEIVLKEARTMARKAAEQGDYGTNDLLVSNVVRTNERQVWFIGEHVVPAPLVCAEQTDGQCKERTRSSLDLALEQ